MAYLHYCGLLDPTVDRDFEGVSVPCIIPLDNDLTQFGRGSSLSRVYGWPLLSDIGYEQKSVQVVSRIHAEITRKRNRNGSFTWTLQDLKSLNGMFVNHIRQDSAVLKDGDILHFGGGHSVVVGTHAKRPATDFVYRFTVCRRNAEIPPADSPKLPLPASLQTAGVHSSPRPQNSSASPVRRLPSVKRTLEEDADAEGNSGPTKFARQCTAVVGPKLPSPLRTVVQVVPPVPPRKWDVALNVADAMVASLHTTTGTSSALAATPSSLASEILPELCCPLCAGIMIDPVVAQCSHGFCLSCIIQRLQSKESCPVCDVRLIPTSTKPVSTTGKLKWPVVVYKSALRRSYHLDSVIEVCVSLLPPGHASVAARNSGISRHNATLAALKFSPEVLTLTLGHEDDDAILEPAMKRTSVFDEPEPIDSDASAEHDWESSDTESEA